jgi:hypothetical protein
MEGIVFLLLILGIGLTIYLVNNHLDGFQAELVIPKAGPPPPKIEDPAPFAPPSTSLLAPPPGQSASVNSKPYSDPALKKASNDAINNIYVTIQGFLKNEAPKITDLGDPTIQLPLNTARADARRLEDELAVLKRNPGLESSLTEEDLFGMQANVGYLQKKWRLSANNTVEGFDCGCKAWFTATEGFEDAPAIVPVTMEDLSGLSMKIGVEIVRLQASGTTDEITQGRIKTLTAIKSTVDDNISEVTKGNKKIEEVQLNKSDIDTFLPLMSNLNSPLPQLVKEAGVNPIVQSLFEKYAGGDAEGAKAAQAMFDKYAAHILKNVSMNINVKYTGEGEQEMAMNELMASVLTDKLGESCPDDAPESSGHPGYFNSVVQDMGVTLPGSGVKPAKGVMPGPLMLGTTMPEMPGAPAMPAKPSAEPSFDWKGRAQQICDQVVGRGLDPSDFGCIKDQNSVSDGYSWRGNVKLVCSRLQTHSDPGVRESCGCPPVAWAGWR